jgi:hypothetical protein
MTNHQIKQKTQLTNIHLACQEKRSGTYDRFGPSHPNHNLSLDTARGRKKMTAG